MRNSRANWGVLLEPRENPESGLLAIQLAILNRLRHYVWRQVIGTIDRWTDPPIMRQRIKAGSDKYFEWQSEHEGDSELDEMFDTGHDDGADDD